MLESENVKTSALRAKINFESEEKGELEKREECVRKGIARDNMTWH